MSPGRKALAPGAASLPSLRGRMRKRGLEGVLFAAGPNLRYLSGFSGSEGCGLVLARSARLFVDGRYIEQAAKETGAFRPLLVRRDFPGALGRFVRRRELKRVGFEAPRVSYALFRKLRKAFSPARLVPVEDWVEEFRLRKTGPEVAALRRAADLADRAMTVAPGILRSATSEREVALRLEIAMRKGGADKPSFDIIAASGRAASMPHALPGERPLRRGPVVVDLGSRLGGYNSDLTRTFCMGRLTHRFREIYNTVLASQLAAIEAIRPGAKASDVDRAARRILDRRGLEKYFGHSLGHGIGLEIHEAPTLSPRSRDTLEPAMVVTVEPGVYIPGWGGIRIEDMVLVTKTGAELLTRSPKGIDKCRVE